VHVLTALRGSLQSGDLNEKNVSIGIVGKVRAREVANRVCA
jgi:hypothetical protein